jgi:hypothetical protein
MSRITFGLFFCLIAQLTSSIMIKALKYLSSNFSAISFPFFNMLEASRILSNFKKIEAVLIHRSLIDLA